MCLLQYDFNSKTVIKYSQCENVYHFKCLKKVTGVAKTDIEK